jgi:uncharacterized SAM-binding protein YcdF (DUF218 family)
LCGVLAAGVLAWAEVVHCRSSERSFPERTGTPPLRGAAGVVVVLGVANRGLQANLVNRWRARMALRSVPQGALTTIVTSGGAVRGPVPEATLLARYLRDVLMWRGALVQETASRSTWNNVANVIPELEGSEWIMLVSNSLHAEKARVYLRRQRPDLADRLVRAADYRFGEMTLIKPILAVVGLLRLRSLR